MDGPVHCITCNTTFPSQVCLQEHPCPGSSCDLAKVKTEVEDSEQEVEGTQTHNGQQEVKALQTNSDQVRASETNSVQVKAESNMVTSANIKIEYTTECPKFTSEVTNSSDALNNVPWTNVPVIDHGYANSLRDTQRGRPYRGNVSHRRGGQHGRGMVQLPKSPNKEPKTAVDLHTPPARLQPLSDLSAGTSHRKQPLKSILPKATSDGKSNDGATWKIDGVFYTQSSNNNMSVVKVANSPHCNRPAAGEAKTSVLSPVSRPTAAMPRNLALNSLYEKKLPPWVGKTINIQFNSPISGNNNLQNSQQSSLILRGSAPLVNAVPGMSILQRPGLVPVPQAINQPQPLTNLSNLSTGLCIQPNMAQVVSTATPRSPLITSNMNQVVGSVIAPTASSQQFPYSVPVLMGNKIVLMSFQNSTGMPPANRPFNIRPPILIQSPNSLSSTITSSTTTEQSAANAGGTSRPMGSALTNSNNLQSVFTQSTIAAQYHPRQPLTGNIGGVLVNTCTQNSPANLILVRGPTSQLLNQVSSQMCSQDFTKTMLSGTKINSSSSPLLTLRNGENLTSGIQKEESDVNCIDLCSLDSSEDSNTCDVSEDNSQPIADQQTDIQYHTLTFNCVTSNSEPIITKADIVPTITTSSGDQSVVSTNTNSGSLVAPGMSLLNMSHVNLQNVIQQSSLPIVIQQPVLSQTTNNTQHDHIPVLNKPVGLRSTPGLYLQNALNVQALNFPVPNNSGKNVQIQNKADNKAAGIGSNQQQLFLKSSIRDSSVRCPLTNPVPSTSSQARMSKVPQKPSSSNNKSNEVYVFPGPQLKRGSLLKRNICLEKKTTASTTKKTLLLSAKKKHRFPGMHTFNLSDVSKCVVKSQKEPKTVKEILQTQSAIKPVAIFANISASLCSTQGSVVTQSPPTLPLDKRLRPCEGSVEELSVPNQALKDSNNKSSLVHKLTNQLETQSRPLKKQILPQCDNSTNYCLDGSDLPQSDNNAICKIVEVKSMAKLHSKIETNPRVFLKSNKWRNGKCTKGTLFVGPLSKEQLDNIVQNPSELEKYVSVPSGHIISTKALVVPSTLKMTTTVSQGQPTNELPARSLIPTQAVLQPEPTFIKIRPKPMLQAVESPSHSATTNTVSSVVTSFPQTSLLINCISSNVPKTFSSNLNTDSVNSFEETENAINIDTENPETEQVNNTTFIKSLSCSGGTRKRKFLSELRRQELNFGKNKDSPNSGLLKLSFVGDMNLLKDALRRSTVPLQRLDPDSNALSATVKHYNSQVKNSHTTLEKDVSNCSENNKKLKLRRKKFVKHEKSKKNDKTFGVNAQEWIPFEVVGDLTIRGGLLDSKEVNEEECGRRKTKRRSDRISAKPRLDYADLEILPFKDLDEDIQEQEYYFESESPSQSPRVLEQVHKDGSFVNITSPHSSGESRIRDCKNSDNSVFASQDIGDSDCVTSTPELESYYYSSESESDMFEPCVESLSKADKKKIMWKQQNEITMFLVKHAGSFSSDDENNEYYCKICHKYKTNGIFRLSHHLKKHLSGSLKCPQCAFEAYNEENLAQHRKTLHLL